MEQNTSLIEKGNAFFKDSPVSIEEKGNPSILRHAGKALAVALGLGLIAPAMAQGQDPMQQVLGVVGYTAKGMVTYKVAKELDKRGTNYAVAGAALGITDMLMDKGTQVAKEQIGYGQPQPSYGTTTQRQNYPTYQPAPAYQPVPTYPQTQGYTYSSNQNWQAPAPSVPVFTASLAGRSRDANSLHVKIRDPQGRDVTALVAQGQGLEYSQTSGTMKLPTLQAGELLKQMGVYETEISALSLDRFKNLQQLSKTKSNQDHDRA